jgi:hypothetical protein
LGIRERRCARQALGGFWIQRYLGRRLQEASIEVGALDVGKVNGHRAGPRFKVVDIAGPVRGQICLAVLVLGELELAAPSRLAACSKP